MQEPRRPEDPFQAALRRAILRAEHARHAIGEVPPRVAFELRRKSVHVLVAVVAVPLLLLAPFWVALSVALLGISVILFTWLIERRKLRNELLSPYRDLVHEPVATALEKTRRPGEDFPWSPVLYTASLIVIGLAHRELGLSWTIAFAAYAMLGIGDAASALVGVAYGRRRLPWNRKKSLEGLSAGFAAGALGGLGMAGVAFAFYGAAFPLVFVGVVIAGAAAGALAESLPRVEDNFAVPIAAAAVMFALSLVLQIPLP